MDTELEKKQIGLYIHIPFCHTKCTYCDFNTYTGLENLIDDFIKSICDEIEFWSLNNSYIINSIFIGGGTPSYIEVKDLEKIIKKVKDNFNIAENTEVTLEINPEDVTKNKARLWKKIGINRCSIGIQSLNDEELKLINRRHSASKAVKSLNTLKDYFTNISVDLIYGLPNQNIKTYLETLEKIIEINPSHISAYSLQVEKGTFLNQQVSRKEVIVANDDISAEMYKLTQKILRKNKYKNYEISNWSKDKLYSEHNLKYWKLMPYIGVGPGAHSYIENKRFSVIKSPKKYISTIKEINKHKIIKINEKIKFLKQSTFFDVYEEHNLKNEILEFLMLSLRLDEGIDLKKFKHRFKLDFDHLYLNKIENYFSNNILEKNKDFYKLTEKGKLFANEVANNFVD
tara:strand:+ start:7488 stop:8687 length:1200 start_codon:yes stop_codon:yes gene_type:complete